LAQKSGALERAALWKCETANWEVHFGFPAQARRLTDECLTLSTGHDVNSTAALVFALSDDLVRSKKLTDKLKKDYPLDTLVQYHSVPTALAAIAVKRGNPEEAIEILRVTFPYERTTIQSAYLRGIAYLAAKKWTEAAAEFQELLDHPGVAENDPVGALAHLQLGRAQAMGGDKAGAQKSYEDFLTLWKDADPDIAIHKPAKAEYAKLQ
jgi:tetratricopeptide (TPR) repeat protein